MCQLSYVGAVSVALCVCCAGGSDSVASVPAQGPQLLCVWATAVLYGLRSCGGRHQTKVIRAASHRAKIVTMNAGHDHEVSHEMNPLSRSADLSLDRTTLTLFLSHCNSLTPPSTTHTHTHTLQSTLTLFSLSLVRMLHAHAQGE